MRHITSHAPLVLSVDMCQVGTEFRERLFLLQHGRTVTLLCARVLHCNHADTSCRLLDQLWNGTLPKLAYILANA